MDRARDRDGQEQGHKRTDTQIDRGRDTKGHGKDTNGHGQGYGHEIDNYNGQLTKKLER
jgi:hypothetical protein